MKLGAHMSTAGGKHKAIERGLAINCESIQVFVKSNRRWKAGALTEKDIEKFRQVRQAHEGEISSIICHGTYLVNLAAQEPENLQKSIDCFEVELDYCTKLGLDSLVFHPGSPRKMGKDKGIVQIAESLNDIMKKFAKSPVLVLLENTAGQGSAIGTSFSELSKILDLLEEQKKFGVCYDTCHGFCAGYDIRDEKTYNKTMKTFDDEIGLDRIRAFHINDSMYDLGEKRDRHAHIGEGKIGKEGFTHLVNDSRFEDIPGTLETPDAEKYEHDLKLLRSLVK
ncbi:MAG: deoxyribonuclease IV [Promethearchaeota archaeon]